jgi:hypothetical protein
MLLIVGLVIVIYAKKDQKTKVIIISSKQLKKTNSSNQEDLHIKSFKDQNLKNSLLKSNPDISESIENEWVS